MKDGGPEVADGSHSGTHPADSQKSQSIDPTQALYKSEDDTSKKAAAEAKEKKKESEKDEKQLES